MIYNTNEGISEETKEQITKDLRNYVDNVAGGSANKAKQMLRNVSGAYISHVLNKNWKPLSDDAWRNIQNQVTPRKGWTIVGTRGYEFLNKAYADARLNAQTLGIIGATGSGKTAAAINQSEGNVFVIKSNEYFTPRTFLEEILSLMGKNGYGQSLAQMMNTIIDTLLKMDHPLIVIDEADKLNDKVLYFFISLYNALEDKCGLIIQATEFLRKRIEDGVLKGKKGYPEIKSRIGGVFLTVPKPTIKDVSAICMANGLYNEDTITSIYNTADGDIRAVKIKVHAYLKLAS